MAEAESAHTTGAPASSRTMSYRDLNAADGPIHLPVLMTLALRKARAERAEYLAIGLTKPWRQCLSEALKRTWEVAKQQRDAIADRTVALAVEPADALRREIDLLPYREDYRAATARGRDIAAELARHAN
jgi:hypothetical protein